MSTYVCPNCGEVLTNNRINRHKNAAHKNIDLPFTCSFCNQKFKTTDLLNNHTDKNHRSRKQAEATTVESSREINLSETTKQTTITEHNHSPQQLHFETQPTAREHDEIPVERAISNAASSVLDYQFIITADSIKCLQENEGWINSEMIVCYLNEVVLAHGRNETLLVSSENFRYADCPTVWSPEEANNTGLVTYPRYLRDWKYALMPIWHNNHWFLAIAFADTCIIKVFDTKHGDYLVSVRDRLCSIASLLSGCDRDFDIIQPDRSTFYDQTKFDDGWTCGYHVCLIADRIMQSDEPQNDIDLIYDLDVVQQWRIERYNELSTRISTDKEIIPKAKMTFKDESVYTFNQYYPNLFCTNPIQTLFIPSSNDLVDDYFRGIVNRNDRPSNYNAQELKRENKRTQKEIDQLRLEANKLLKQAKTMTSQLENELMINVGSRWLKWADLAAKKMKRSDQPLNRLNIIEKHREKDTVTLLINAFRDANIGGVLILSPRRKPLQNYIETTCKKYPILQNFPKAFKQHQRKLEICDCIYFHPILGIYVIEVKATDRLQPLTVDERKLLTKKEIQNNAYEKAIYQLSQMITLMQGESMSSLQKLYILITASENLPRMSGIMCTPNAKLGEMTHPENLDARFRHFHFDLFSSIEQFRQFWTTEISNYDRDNRVNLFNDENYQHFLSVMANCSVGRKLYGVNNAVSIAKIIYEQKIDPTITDERTFVTNDTKTIFLNAKQIKILNDTSKLKIIFGPPGTGKTLLVILAAIDAVKQENGKVIVFTRDRLVEYMKRIFTMNRFDKNTIEVRDFVVGIRESNVNEYIFVDECAANESNLQIWLNDVKQIRNVKLFVAISGQGDIDELCSIEEQIIQLLKNENDYRIFQLTEILRGTKSIIDFWINRFDQILPKELQMECGHSIVGENVDYYGQYMKINDIMDKMEERLKELLIKNQPNNIVIIYNNDYEKRIIESRLKLVKIAFGSTIEQDNNHSLIAVESSDNTYSREWPFVIYVYLFPYDYRQISIISSSRAIAHLTLIERNVKEIRRRIRDKCDDNMMKAILSSFDEYKQFRNQIDLADDEGILYDDLSVDIISFNYFASQIKQLYPNIFNDCNTFDQFLDIIVNKEQWMLLLFVHQWEYFQKMRHVDKLINVIIEYKQSTEWIESFEIEEMRAECLINNAKIAIELINKFIQPQVEEMMKTVVTDNRQLFEVFNNSNGKHQFDLMANSIQPIIWIDCTQIYTNRKVEINTTKINNNIAELLLNLLLLANRQQLTIQP